MPWRNFSHTLGTPKNNVGRQALEILGHGGEAPREPGLAAGGDLTEVADRALGDVAEGQERQEAIVRAQLDQRRQAAHRRHDVGVRDHRALGRPGGPAGVDDGRQLGGSDAGDEARELSAVRAGSAEVEQAADEAGVGIVVITSEEHDELEVGELVAPPDHLRQLVGLIQEAAPCLAVAQDVGDLLRRVARIDRHAHEAGGQDAEISDVPLRTVRGQDRHPVAGFEPGGTQPVGDLGDGEGVLGPGACDPLPVLPSTKRRSRGMRGGGPAEELDHGGSCCREGRDPAVACSTRLGRCWCKKTRHSSMIGRPVPRT